MHHIFFDLDDTLTQSRSLMDSEMEKVLVDLVQIFDVTVVSGATVEQIKKQIPPKILDKCYILAQNGNFALHKDGKTIWAHKLSTIEKKVILFHIKTIAKKYNIILGKNNDHVEDRGCQISFSLVGHHADLDLKKRFDPGGKRRAEILKAIPIESNTVDVKIGGTTCLDYFEKGKNKGSNVVEFIKKLGWKKEEALYVGDALYPGGNDEDVVGLIKTQTVKGPSDTLEFIRTLL